MTTRRASSPEGRSSGKRRRTNASSADSTERNVNYGPASYGVDTKVPGHEIEPGLLIVHKVLCSRQTIAHAQHEPSSYFFDQPRLYKGDNKTQPLRGKEPIPNFAAYSENNPRISIMVERSYDCFKYQNLPDVSCHFERLVAPSCQENIPSNAQPYLFALDKDTKPAVPVIEQITHYSDDFFETLDLVQQFCETAQQKPCAFSEWSKPDNLTAPYLQFFHARKLLDSIQELLETNQRRQLAILLDYIHAHFGREYAEADELFSQGYFTDVHFHKLYGPGEVVVISENGREKAFEIKSCPVPHTLPIKISGETWTFDGSFHREPQVLTVGLPSDFEPDQKASISSLTAIPLAFDNTGLEKRLRQRGDFFWSCRKGRLVTSTGPRRGFNIQVTNPRYMIDMQTYNLIHPDNDEESHQADILPWTGDLTPEQMHRADPPPGNFLLLLPPTIKAFRFHDRRWKTLAVEHLRDIKWDTEAFKKLVFDPEKKKLIEALVHDHVANSSSADIIESKGNGLVILLHGPPGTGKTLTAESVAEYSKRPLYRLTSGDIGTNPEDVEKSLEHIFYLGNTWKPVVLLDECEVFMEERVPSDLARNALVSVFLRALEYYDGILILTSNRVGTFDEAFKSRMHLAVYYPPLKDVDREEIWSIFFQKLADEKEKDPTLDIDIKGLMRSASGLAQFELNGRQIRNAIRTARQRAVFEKEEFTAHHIRGSIRVIREFEEYVEATQGETSARRAELAGLRKNVGGTNVS